MTRAHGTPARSCGPGRSRLGLRQGPRARPVAATQRPSVSVLRLYNSGNCAHTELYWKGLLFKFLLVTVRAEHIGPSPHMRRSRSRAAARASRTGDAAAPPARSPRVRQRGHGELDLNCTSCQVTGPGRRAWACELESERWSGRTGTQTSILKPMGRQKEDVSLLAAAADSDSDPGPGQTMMKLLRGPGRAVLGLGLPGRNMTRTTGSEHGTT